MHSRLNIVIVTTARSDFNTVKPLASLLIQEGFNCKLLVGGMHLVKNKGFSLKEIEALNLPILAKMNFFDEGADMTPSRFISALSVCTKQAGDILGDASLDLLIVTGDRIENIPIMLAAKIYQIKMLHICGGDETAGSLDNVARDLMTRLANWHCVSMGDHYNKLCAMGIDPKTIFITGDPGIDELHNTKRLTKTELLDRLSIRTNRYCIFIYHPETDPYFYDPASIMSALEEYAMVNTVLYIEPNLDPCDSENRQNMSTNLANFITIPNLETSLFYNALYHCDFIIGNSSSGIWEAPSFGIPSINVGLRQSGRKRNSNILDVPVHDKDQIRKAIGQQLRSHRFKNLTNHFGNGSASLKILDVIKGL